MSDIDAVEKAEGLWPYYVCRDCQRPRAERFAGQCSDCARTAQQKGA